MGKLKNRPGRSALAIELKTQAAVERSLAKEAERDRVPGWVEESRDRRRWAKRLEAEARALMGPRDEVEVHPGGEVIPEGGTDPNHWLVNTLKEEPSQLAVDASHRRKELLSNMGFDALELGLDAAMSLESSNSLEKMLVHQLASAHLMAMDFQEQARRLPSNTPSDVATKLINSAARMMDVYRKGYEALARVKTGRQQVVRVIHQYVQVEGGGQAVVAGNVATKEGVNG